MGELTEWVNTTAGFFKHISILPGKNKKKTNEENRYLEMQK